MKNEKQIFERVSSYLAGEITLFELQDWISSRETYWASLARDNPGRRLAGRIMLAYYEYGAGHRDEESLREVAREAIGRLSSQPA